MSSQHLWVPMLLFAAVAALYGQFLWNPLQFDDRDFFLLDNAGSMPISVFQYSALELRSLPYATLAWTNGWFGLDLINFRVGNLLLHAAVVLALYYFLMGLFAAVYIGNFRKGLSPRHAAFFAALLFALHPVATYAAGYLVQRSIVMATLFTLLAMLVYMHGSIQQKPLWLWMSVPFYYLAVFSKEHAIMLPFVLLALTMLLHNDWRIKLKQRVGIFVALAAIAMMVLLIKKGLLGSVYEPAAAEMLRVLNIESAYPLSVITQSWLFFKYAFLWVAPNPAWMSIDMREPFAQSLFSPYLIATVFFGAWGASAFWLMIKRGNTGLAGFALLFPWLMFFVEFSSVRIQEPFVLYRSYLWAVGAFCMLPVIVNKVNHRVVLLVLSMVVMAMFSVSMERLLTLSNSVLVWDDAEKLIRGRTDLPGASRIYYNRGTELLRMDSPDRAMIDLKQAIAIDGNFGNAHANLGAAYAKKGDWKNSVASFSKAIEIFISDPQWKQFYGRAIAFEKLGELQLAQADFRVTCFLAQKGCEKLPGGNLSGKPSAIR